MAPLQPGAIFAFMPRLGIPDLPRSIMIKHSLAPHLPQRAAAKYLLISAVLTAATLTVALAISERLSSPPAGYGSLILGPADGSGRSGRAEFR
jgi:hypothetical protein